MGYSSGYPTASASAWPDVGGYSPRRCPSRVSSRDQRGGLQRLEPHRRLADEHGGVALAGLAGAAPHGAAFELDRNRKLGDLAYCVRHRSALSAHSCAWRYLANGASSLSRIEPPTWFNVDCAIL